MHIYTHTHANPTKCRQDSTYPMHVPMCATWHPLRHSPWPHPMAALAPATEICNTTTAKNEDGYRCGCRWTVVTDSLESMYVCVLLFVMDGLYQMTYMCSSQRCTDCAHVERDKRWFNLCHYLKRENLRVPYIKICIFIRTHMLFTIYSVCVCLYVCPTGFPVCV